MVLVAPAGGGWILTYAALGNGPFLCDEQAGFPISHVEDITRLTASQVDPVNTVGVLPGQTNFHS